MSFSFFCIKHFHYSVPLQINLFNYSHLLSKMFIHKSKKKKKIWILQKAAEVENVIRVGRHKWYGTGNLLFCSQKFYVINEVHAFDDYEFTEYRFY